MSDADDEDDERQPADLARRLRNEVASITAMAGNRNITCLLTK